MKIKKIVVPVLTTPFIIQPPLVIYANQSLQTAFEDSNFRDKLNELMRFSRNEASSKRLDRIGLLNLDRQPRLLQTLGPVSSQEEYDREVAKIPRLFNNYYTRIRNDVESYSNVVKQELSWRVSPYLIPLFDAGGEVSQLAATEPLNKLGIYFDDILVDNTAYLSGEYYLPNIIMDGDFDIVNPRQENTFLTKALTQMENKTSQQIEDPTLAGNAIESNGDVKAGLPEFRFNNDMKTLDAISLAIKPSTEVRVRYRVDRGLNYNGQPVRFIDVVYNSYDQQKNKNLTIYRNPFMGVALSAQKNEQYFDLDLNVRFNFTIDGSSDENIPIQIIHTSLNNRLKDGGLSESISVDGSSARLQNIDGSYVKSNGIGGSYQYATHPDADETWDLYEKSQTEHQASILGQYANNQFSFSLRRSGTSPINTETDPSIGTLISALRLPTGVLIPEDVIQGWQDGAPFIAPPKVDIQLAYKTIHKTIDEVTLEQENDLQPKKQFDGYVWVESKQDDWGNNIHIYKPLSTEWKVKDTNTILRIKENGLLEKDTFERYNFDSTTHDEEGNRTHWYTPIVTENVQEREGWVEVNYLEEGTDKVLATQKVYPTTWIDRTTARDNPETGSQVNTEENPDAIVRIDGDELPTVEFEQETYTYVRTEGPVGQRMQEGANVVNIYYRKPIPPVNDDATKGKVIISYKALDPTNGEVVDDTVTLREDYLDTNLSTPGTPYNTAENDEKPELLRSGDVDYVFVKMSKQINGRDDLNTTEGEVVTGVTHVTYYYVPIQKELTTEEFKDSLKTAKYDKQGNLLGEEKDIDVDVLVKKVYFEREFFNFEGNKTYRTEKTQVREELGKQGYNLNEIAETVKPQEFNFNGKDYTFVEWDNTSDKEIDTYEGTGKTYFVKYIYDVKKNPITKWVEKDTDIPLTPQEEGTLDPREFDGYIFDSTEVNENETIHKYRKVWTIHITTEDVVLKAKEDGTHPKEIFDGYEFVETRVEEGNTTHIYTPKQEEPEQPIIPKTRWVEEETDIPLTPQEEGTLDPREFDGYIFNRTVVEGDVTIHKYVKSSTIWVTEDGEILSPKVPGLFNPKDFDDYELVKTEEENYNRKHIYKKVLVSETKETFGSVIVKYVDTEGNTLKEDVLAVDNQLVKTTITKTHKGEVVEKQETLSGFVYGLEDLKLETIGEFTYKEQDKPLSDKLVEGETVITLVYEKLIEPTPEEPKPELPKVEEPKPEEPKTPELPKEEPKEEPKPEEPKPNIPVQEEPKETPKVEVPGVKKPQVQTSDNGILPHLFGLLAILGIKRKKKD